MNMYAQTKVLPCQKGKFEKQDCGLVWLYWNSLKSTAVARRVNYPWIANCSMDSTNEDFIYPRTLNSSIHVQLDELVYFI